MSDPIILALSVAALVALVVLFIALFRRFLSAHEEVVRLEALNSQKELQSQLISTQTELQSSLSLLQEKKRELEASQSQLSEIQVAHAAAKEQLQGSLEQQRKLEQRQSELELEREDLRQDLNLQRVSGARLLAQIEEERKAAEEKLQLVSRAEKQFTDHFENLAQRIFQEKTERWDLQSKQRMEHMLNPLREQLGEFRAKVEDVYVKEAKDRQYLVSELHQLKRLNQQMSEDAINLTRALKGESKVQGSWGEVILERLLEESGLRKGHEYETQMALSDEEGRKRMPDVVVHLPENKDIIIDAKVSLAAYERYCSAEDEDQQQQALQEHRQSIRRHIKILSEKGYENLETIRSLDFVFIFVPIESAFMLALEQDQALFQQAYEQNIIIVSPTTLLATLRTVQNIWRYERQNRNAEKIAQQAGALHDHFILLLNALQDIGKHLDKSRESYDKVMSRLFYGRGNLVKRVEQLEQLGAKTKRKIPDEFTDMLEEDKTPVS